MSLFYKLLGSPIIDNTSFPTTGPYAGYKVSQFHNAGSAWVDGVEVSYQQRWANLSGLLGGLGFSGNFTFTNSETFKVDPLRSQNPKLLRQSPVAWNLGPTYDRGPLSLNLGLEFNDTNINSYQYEDLQFATDANGNPTNVTTPLSPAPIGGYQGPAGDNYFYTHLQVDAQISYRLPKGFSAYVNGQNLTNEVFGFYNGGPQYVNQREYYKPTYFGGLRWTSHHE